MKNEKVLPDEVRTILEAIRADVAQLHCRWRAFNEIYGQQDSVDLINYSARNFFDFVYEATLNEMILAVTRKTDPKGRPGKDTLGFEQLAQQLENHGFKMLSKRIKSRVKKLRPRSKKEFVLRRDSITFSRNNRVSHSSLLIRTNRSSKPLPDLPINKFERALQLFREMLDITDAMFGINSPRYENLRHADSGRLLYNLRVAHAVLESPHRTDILQLVNPEPNS